jgi:hypothetical protein
MRALAAAALLIASASSAFAYDECGAPPERPSLPADPVHAGEADALGAQRSNRDYRMDIEGYLTCQQLAEFDVAAEAQRGERTQESADALRLTFHEQAADARGRQSGWLDDYAHWIRAWEKAHGKPAPSAPED